MLNSRGVLSCVVVLMVLVLQARADTYYMRSSGHDKNDGRTPATAVTSLDRVSKLVGAGDTVYIGAGSYSGRARFTSAGTPDHPIRLIGDVSGVHTGDAGEVFLTHNNSSPVIELQNAHHFEIHAVTIESGSEGVRVNASRGCLLRGVTIGNVREASVAVINNGTVRVESGRLTALKRGVQVNNGHAVVLDTVIGDLNEAALEMSNSGSSIEARRCTISNARYGAYADNGTLTLVNTLITRTAREAVYTRNDTTLTMVHCTVDNANGDGARFRGRSTLHNNIFTNITGHGMNLDGGSVSASHNLVFNQTGERSRNFDSIEYDFDPRYRDAAGGDFTLSPDSGAIDIGYEAGEYTDTDRLGVARPSGRGWDLGAFESEGGVAAVDLPYVNDFESGVGNEWSDTRSDTTRVLSTFLGRHGRETAGGVAKQTEAAITVRTTPGELYYIVYDLYAIDAWNGDSAKPGPDRFRLSAGELILLDESLSANGTNHSFGRYPDEHLQAGFGNRNDGIYRNNIARFVASGNETRISWRGGAEQDIGDASWGLDNIRIFHESDAEQHLPLFASVSVEFAFNLQNSSEDDSPSGILWGDLDGDGLPDALVTGLGSVALMNRGHTFEAAWLGRGAAWGQGALFDADNDGDLDFFIACLRGDDTAQLLLNDGTGTLSFAGAAGFGRAAENLGLAAGDFNADGRTDIALFSGNGVWMGLNTGDPAEDGFKVSAGMDGAALRASRAGERGFVSTADANNDGFLDFFFHDSGGRLFLSDGRGGYVEDRNAIDIPTGGAHASGSAWGDFNNNGWMDLFVPSRRRGERGTLFVNRGGVFHDITDSAGIGDTSEQFSAAWGDSNNNGLLDLLITTGADSPMLLYLNRGDGTFALATNGPVAVGKVHDAVFVDFDNDGDLDIAATRPGGTNVLLRNILDNDRFLKVRPLQRTADGADVAVIGARVELFDARGEPLGRRDVGVARGFGGAEPMWAHFGGVEPDEAHTVRITWPGGDTSTTPVVPAEASTAFGVRVVDQMLTVVQEPETRVRVVRWREISPTD